MVASSWVTVCCARARPAPPVGLPAAAALLAGALATLLLAAVLLAGVLVLEEPPELHAASSPAAVTAIPGTSQYFCLSVIAFTSAESP